MKTELEKIFDQTDWERKFEYKLPDRDIVYVWRESQAKDAKRKLSRLQEEVKKFYRCLWLGSDSIGQVLCMTEHEWDKEY